MVSVKNISGVDSVKNKTICGDTFKVLELLPENSFDLLFADPPYNLTKNFGENSFKQTSLDEYETWLESWLADCALALKDALASVNNNVKGSVNIVQPSPAPCPFTF